ncbi:hypothetical protein [Blastopirellula marina]|uniref:YcxB-like protein domain-containing protein n=1 Tax=Blastopirellula marina TaxID=124 RepID=A0A2S8GGH7_9BACT|nr:hypothetical protein [Blastopirellula marina]PQO43568.1 hypothetical protein C5Y93_23245 [Blastopirellula marina]
MEIAFETSPADSAVYEQLAPPRSRWRLFWEAHLRWFLFAAGPAILPWLVTGQWRMGGGFMLTFAIFWFLLFFLVRSAPQQTPEEEQQRYRLRLTPAGIMCRRQSSSTWITWALIDSVQSHPVGVQLLMKAKRSIWVPTRAFANAEAQTQFTELAQQYLAAALNAPTAEFPASDDPEFLPWTSDLSQSVAYQNQADELAYVFSAGINYGYRPNLYLMTALFLAMLLLAATLQTLGLLTLLSDFFPDHDAADARVMFVIGGLLWFYFAVTSITTIHRWIYRRYLPEPLLSPVRLTIMPQGYVLRSSLATHCDDWNNLALVVENKEFLAFRTSDRGYCCILPKRALPHPPLADKFADDAIGYWEAAQQSNQATPDDDSPDNHTDHPDPISHA